jgi:hypothetical protein
MSLLGTDAREQLEDATEIPMGGKHSANLCKGGAAETVDTKGEFGEI